MKNIHDFIDLIAQIWDKGLGLFIPILLIGFGMLLMNIICDVIELPSSRSIYDLIMGDYVD
jgi:hypothetical protein